MRKSLEKGFKRVKDAVESKRVDMLQSLIRDILWLLPKLKAKDIAEVRADLYGLSIQLYFNDYDVGYINGVLEALTIYQLQQPPKPPWRVQRWLSSILWRFQWQEYKPESAQSEEETY